ncbi:MAG: Spy/CpxP family protein refolding chaperone [Planctomycetes bacterium]|nr:Spy/CpxP family protein refolding chaperone [Planctomycetota bacterium]
MTRKKGITVACGAMLAIAAVGIIGWTGQSAQALGKGELGGRPMLKEAAETLGRFLILRSQLNVTPEQRGKVRAIMQSHSDEIVPVAKAIVEKNRALRKEVFAEKPDDASIRAAADQLGKAIGDAAVLAAGIRGETRKVMTPEQIEKIEEFRVYKDRAVDSVLERLPSLLAQD